MTKCIEALRSAVVALGLAIGCSAPSASVDFAGTSGPVSIARDELGIPHIRAETDADAYFGSGYAQAVDRGSAIERMRRRALGTEAAVVGASAVAQDEFARALGFARWAEREAESIAAQDPARAELLAAWCAGVSRRLREQRELGTGDAWIAASSDWTIADLLAVERSVIFGIGNVLSQEMLATQLRSEAPELFADASLFAPFAHVSLAQPQARPEPSRIDASGAADEMPPIVLRDLAAALDRPRELPRGATNAIAVAGDHTANGHPMLAMDPHQSEGPSTWWFQRLESAEGLDVSGASLVGTAGVHFGSNRHVAWAATASFQDTLDLWVVEGADRSVARIGGRSIPIVRREERIEVAGAEPVIVEVLEVPDYGVLLPESSFALEGTQRLLIRWTGFEPGHSFGTFDAVARARSVGEVREALQGLRVGSFHWVFADAEQIGTATTGWVPERGAGASAPFAALRGDDETTFWRTPLGSAPSPELAESTSDAIVAANQNALSPEALAAYGGAARYGVFFDPGVRAQRLAARLAEAIDDRAIDRAAIEAILLDEHSPLAAVTVPVLQRSMQRARGGLTEHELRTLYELSGWNYEMAADSRPALVFALWIHFAARELLEPRLGRSFEALAHEQPMFVLQLAAQILNGRNGAALLDAVEGGVEGAMLRALRSTAATLFAHPEWTQWGDVHREILRGHDGALRAVAPVGGFDDSIAYAGSRFFARANDARPFDAVGRSAWRAVWSFDEQGRPQASLSLPLSNDHDSRPRGQWTRGEFVTASGPTTSEATLVSAPRTIALAR